MTVDAEELEAQADALRKAGHYEEAAELLLGAGHVVRAAQLFADVWQYDRAIDVAAGAGRLDIAYRHALTAQDRGRSAELLAALAEHPEQALRAAEHAEERGRTTDAARLREAAGEIEAAAALFERAGELFDAARCREAAGDYRGAGLLYERRVREAPDDGEAALRLGRILAQFGRYEHAVRALQRAVDDPQRERAALRLMVACFAAQGMGDAAASCLDRLRAEQPELPVTVPEFLEEAFGDARGIVGLAEQGDAATLLAGRYRVVRALGAGATGRVVLAHDGFYDREVAIKILTVGGGAQGRDAYVRFAREARVAAGLEHPNVVRVYEFNPDGPFLVMELMPGGTLEDRLVDGGGRLPLPVLRHVMRSVLDGLLAVHRRGVVHRDLKPANVFFGAAGDVKIGDFGVAHLTDLGATLTGAMLGTLAYMAPEQITGSHRPDASTDLYALGVILFRCLTGALPFPGPDFVTQHLHELPRAVSALRPALGGFDEVVAALLAKDPEARVRSATDARARLEALVWPEEDALDDAVIGATPVRRSSAPPAPRVGDRYEDLGPEGAGRVARDTLLDRRVRVEPCDAARARRLRELAHADGPHLQAIYSIDDAAGLAVLERPDGEPLAACRLDASARAVVRDQVRAALERIHRSGAGHGAVAAETVIVGPGRAVLLLPPAGVGGAPEQDLEAVARL